MYGLRVPTVTYLTLVWVARQGRLPAALHIIQCSTVLLQVLLQLLHTGAELVHILLQALLTCSIAVQARLLHNQTYCSRVIGVHIHFAAIEVSAEMLQQNSGEHWPDLQPVMDLQCLIKLCPSI